MKKFVFILGLAGLVLALSHGQARPIKDLKAVIKEVPGYRTTTLTDSFKGGETAKVLAIGNYASYTGLYIYDRHGNCVMWDDKGSPSTCDDNAAEWIPGTTGEYTLEVRNLGFFGNRIRIFKL